MAKTRVLLIEDNRLLREGIAATLNAERDFEVIAVAEDGDALHKLKESGKSPDVMFSPRDFLADRERIVLLLRNGELG